jgi:uncharacterized protein (TIGR00255 family)
MSKKVDLSIDFLGVHCENPFFLSSSPVCHNYEMIAKCFDLGWGGVFYKTVGVFVPDECSPRFDIHRKECTPWVGFKNMEQISEHTWQENAEIIKRLKKDYPTKVMGVSIMGSNEEEWALVLQTLNDAVAQFNAFRQQEGLSLYQMFCDKLDAIADLLTQVEKYEQGRVEKIKARIEANLEQLSATTQQAIDRNRLEQEMIYYLEKLDITEEKVRLTNHLRYFRETMDGEGAGVGKKLGFIAQEMGREINTLGSKSNQSEMQIIVVKMKDILEQIKEQVLNVL